MKTLGIFLLWIAWACAALGCDKTDYEQKAEKSAKERAERNRADHERRSNQ